MTGYVLDASVTLAWCFGDEATPATWAIFDRLQSERAAAPSNWPLEVVNIVGLAERTGRLDPADAERFLSRLRQVKIDVESVTFERAAGEIRALAAAERLTAYDAAYLELAIRRGIPLATKDAELRSAARRRGVPVIPD